MSTKMRRDRFKQTVDLHWQRVYNFVFRMTLDHERANAVIDEVFLRAYVGGESMPEEAPRAEIWLFHIASHVVEQKLPKQPEVSFDLLDETLRSEATRTDVVRSLTDPQRDFLLWELKQGCMTSVVNCLPPGERAAFVTSHVLKLKEEDAAKALGVTVAAYKVRLSRARKKVGDYLAPRCEHVNPMNPCRCPARVGVALRKGFIKTSGSEVTLRKPPAPYGRYGAGPDTEDAPMRDIGAIYGNLPEPDAPPDVLARIHAKIDDGTWDKVRDKKK
ncbi:MAG: RNA polymerase sigma factor [Deltaproteobacteria bacterium]|nr:RNA polymerase sigma factor [Deltaproteobacteria bacterium]